MCQLKIEQYILICILFNVAQAKNNILKLHLFKNNMSRVVVAYAFNPNTWEAEAGGSLWVLGQPGLQELVPGQAPKLQRNPVSKNKKRERERERENTQAVAK